MNSGKLSTRRNRRARNLGAHALDDAAIGFDHMGGEPAMPIQRPLNPQTEDEGGQGAANAARRASHHDPHSHSTLCIVRVRRSSQTTGHGTHPPERSCRPPATLPRAHISSHRNTGLDPEIEKSPPPARQVTGRRSSTTSRNGHDGLRGPARHLPSPGFLRSHGRPVHPYTPPVQDANSPLLRAPPQNRLNCCVFARCRAAVSYRLIRPAGISARKGEGGSVRRVPRQLRSAARVRNSLSLARVTAT